MPKPRLPFNRGTLTLQEKAFRQPPRQTDHLKGRLGGQEGARRLGGIKKKTTTKWEIKYKFWQQWRYCKSLLDALKLKHYHQAAAHRHTLESRRRQKQTEIHVVWWPQCWGLFFSQPPVLLFTRQTPHRWNNLQRQEGL